MSNPNIKLLDPSLPVTDESLPIVCAQIDFLATSTKSTSLCSRTKRRRRLKSPISERLNLTIYSSRSDVLQHPIVRAAYLVANRSSKARVNVAVPVEMESRRGLRSLCDGNQSQIGFDSTSDSSCQPGKSHGFLDDQDPQKDRAISALRAVQLLLKVDRVRTLQAQGAFLDSKTLLTTINPSLLRFPGDVIINEGAAQARLSALTEDAASRADAVGVMTGPFAGRTAFWTDASCLASGADDGATACGMGVVYRPQDMQRGSDEWIAEGYRILGPVEITVAEALAVFLALLIAEASFRRKGGEFLWREGTVLIFSDCENALRCIQDFERGRSLANMMVVPNEIIEMILTKAHQLTETGVKIELHWVPGHKGVPGNELADEVAKQAAKGKQLDNRVSALRRGKPISFEREVVSIDVD